MRTGLAIAALLLGAGGSAGAVQDPAIVIEFTNPALSPSHWSLAVHPDGRGHFQSHMGAPPPGEQQEINAPDINRDVQLTTEFAAHLFEVAQHSNWFNEECESHLKVAFQGWKKLSYSGPEGSGSCTFNYSKDKDIQALGDSLVAVAQTIVEGERLEMLLQHDRLGLDKEMEYLVEAAQEGRAQQLCAIRDILTRLAGDDAVMERVRKRARMLLVQADT